MSDVDELRRRWLTLTRSALPSRARTEGWPLVNDHCFQRIVLDAVCGGRWYDSVAGRPAYRYLDEPRLVAAVALAQRLADEPDALALVARLDDQSLRWRGKRPKPGRSSSSATFPTQGGSVTGFDESAPNPDDTTTDGRPESPHDNVVPPSTADPDIEQPVTSVSAPGDDAVETE